MKLVGFFSSEISLDSLYMISKTKQFMYYLQSDLAMELFLKKYLLT